MSRVLAFFVVLLPVMAGSPCGAQRVVPWYWPPGGYSRSYDGNGGYSAFASTPMEGAQRGLAEVIRSRGEAAEARSRAMINYEEARSRYIDNVSKWTRTYWARKRTAEAQREAEYAEKREARDRYLAYKRSKPSPGLSPSQLDPTTGKLYWPEPLLDAQYEQDREKLEEMFLLRAHTSTTPGLSQEITSTVREMQDKLKENIREMTPNRYLAARKFLDGLEYEAAVSGT